MLKKDMQKEIKKYRKLGLIFYLEERKDSSGNMLAPIIKPADWIQSTKDYDHCTFELHHIVPFTDWEKNTRNVRSKTQNALILIRKIMHQHLENPIYKLSKPKFEKTYLINPDVILYDINSKLPRTAELFHYTPNNHSAASLCITNPNTAEFSLTEEDLSCFDSIYQNEDINNAA